LEADGSREVISGCFADFEAMLVDQLLDGFDTQATRQMSVKVDLW
jgi:hypothetical protein